ncbi:hypothetical protein NC652_035363 [Populus alba x Populus x berolinensis]|nr:hypothetical protein NC652_035363 [Populus alba x Populus x berolinensis]
MKQAVLFPQLAQAGDAFHQVLNGLARKLPQDTSVYHNSLPLSPAKKAGLIKVAISEKV